MKTFKNLNGAFGAAALLLGAMAFTACSSDDIASNLNPTYDGESVKTQFAINIPYAGQKGTRMGANETQESNHFLGMYDIRLIPMEAEGADNVALSSILALDPIADKTSTGTPSWGTDDTGFRRVYNDVAIPTGTTNFLFYGRGGTTTPTTPDNKFKNGILKTTIPALGATGKTTNDISFELEKINTETGTNGECTSLLQILNDVASVTGWSAATTTPLQDLYTNFKSLKAGSANTILLTLQKLYNTLELSTIPEGSEAIKTAILGKIGENFDVAGAAGNRTLTFKTTLTYPRNVNLPDGSARIEFKDGTFIKSGANPMIGTNPNVIKMENICYPPSIYYFVNTPLGAYDKENVIWPTTLNDWNAGFGGTDWKETVDASTRTIALKKPIQYGVAKLAVTVTCNAATLEDNDAGEMINVPDAGFPIRGLLVGGQPTTSGWNLKPKTEAEDNVVYDNAIVTGMVAKNGTVSTANYTLVMDNYAAEKKKVYIVLELENNTGTEFKGADGIVPAGGVFYLLATLDPDGQTVTGVDDPYVFMQDYTTKANLTITSLKNAYNVIPDLRSSKLELGLAVDLEWKLGMNFNVEIGGN